MASLHLYYAVGGYHFSPSGFWSIYGYILNRHFLIPEFVAAIFNAPTQQWILYRHVVYENTTKQLDKMLFFYYFNYVDFPLSML
jgi:hypothetical protein